MQVYRAQPAVSSFTGEQYVLMKKGVERERYNDWCATLSGEGGRKEMGMLSRGVEVKSRGSRTQVHERGGRGVYLAR